MKETYKFYKEIKTGKIFPVENEKEIDKDNFIELKANTTDGAKEKHIPVYEKKTKSNLSNYRKYRAPNDRRTLHKMDCYGNRTRYKNNRSKSPNATQSNI